ncbi:MAG: phosphatidate cytidylyltransferase [Gammaproteobacteria bacterium]
MIEEIFVTILIGFAVGASLMALGNRGVPAQVASERWIKLVVYFLVVLTALASAAGGRFSMFVFVALIVTLSAIELHGVSPSIRLGTGGQRAVIWVVFAAVSATAIALTPILSPARWVYLYLLVAVFDGFSQVVGQLIGRRKLAPRISPTKTVEGAIGGLSATVIVGLWFRALLGPDLRAALLLAVAIALAGLCGDLAASWVKRRAGIKDFGAILPGQGGVLDRFDSFLAASAIIGPVIHLAGTA